MPKNESIRAMLAFFFRLFPIRARTGLRIFGIPDEQSPVFVTTNYVLTVKRVSNYLKNLDCYLLVASSNGINVWCAAESGDFNTQSVISVIKTSGISERVRHRRLILPQLCASGIDVRLIKAETGWLSEFGPVYAADIPQYVQHGFRKTESMSRAKRSLKMRFDVAFGSTLPGYLLINLLILFFKPSWLLEANLIAVPAFVAMYTLHPYIPGKEGWKKVLFLELLLLMAVLGYLVFSSAPTVYPVGVFVGAMIIIFLLGVDFGGMDPTFKGELAQFLAKIGIRRLGLMSYKGTERIELATGSKVIQFEESNCSGCGTCCKVCPVGVFHLSENSDKILIENLDTCIACRACYVQCPGGAILLKER